jgi:hypothetical protein
MQLNNESVIPTDIFSFMLNEFHKETGQHSSVLSPTSVASFVAWCHDYLSKNRPAQLTMVTDNYGIMLTNGKSFVLAPPVAAQQIKGSMSSDQGVAIKI